MMKPSKVENFLVLYKEFVHSMYVKPIHTPIAFHTALNDGFRKSNDISCTKEIVTSLYGTKFEKQHVVNDLNLLPPNIRKNVISYPNDCSTPNAKAEITVLEQFIANNTNLGIILNTNPVTERGHVKMVLQANPDFIVSYPSTTVLTPPILVERDVKNAYINHDKLVTSGHVHSLRFDTTKNTVYGVDEERHLSMEHLSNIYEESFRRFQNAVEKKNLLTKSESDLLKAQLHEINQTFSDTTLPIIERTFLVNQKLMVLGGSELAIKTQFNACLVQLSEKYPAEFTDRPSFKNLPYENPFLVKDTKQNDKNNYSRRLLNNALKEDSVLKYNISQSSRPFQPFAKSKVSWTVTEVDSIDTDIFA